MVNNKQQQSDTMVNNNNKQQQSDTMVNNNNINKVIQW